MAAGIKAITKLGIYLGITVGKKKKNGAGWVYL